jgi:hypothetical protein|tara:strand:+ start:166 stop:516 length:351 start_codon:yes stop_codon:yes gene_type:complete
MSNYNWCHNPSCHTIETQSRVRGTGDNKVLRTVKIKPNRYGTYQENIWNYFCNNNCLFKFLNKFGREIANAYPVKQPSETPIKVKKIKSQDYRMRYNGNEYEKIPYTSIRTEIESK